MPGCSSLGSIKIDMLNKNTNLDHLDSATRYDHMIQVKMVLFSSLKFVL